MNRTLTRTTITQTAYSLGLALMVTLATLGSLDHLATERHAAAVLAQAAAAQQAQASATGTAARS